MTAIAWLKGVVPYLHLYSTERTGTPTNSELYRWFKKGSVEINGVRPQPGDEVVLPVQSLVLHPSSKRRITIW